MATREGRLFVVSAQGELRFDSKWPSLSGLAVADIDGDGSDELVLGSERSLALLGRVEPTESGSAF